MYSRGNIINSTVIILYGGRWLSVIVVIKSLCSIPETNTIVYVDYT